MPDKKRKRSIDKADRPHKKIAIATPPAVENVNVTLVPDAEELCPVIGTRSRRSWESRTLVVTKIVGWSFQEKSADASQPPLLASLFLPKSPSSHTKNRRKTNGSFRPTSRLQPRMSCCYSPPHTPSSILLPGRSTMEVRTASLSTTSACLIPTPESLRSWGRISWYCVVRYGARLRSSG